VSSPERFAEGRAFDEYVKYAGSPENLPTLHQEAPPVRTTGCASATVRALLGRKNSIHRPFLLPGRVKDSRQVEDGRGGQHDQGGESDRGVGETQSGLDRQESVFSEHERGKVRCPTCKSTRVVAQLGGFMAQAKKKS
jgi:hypothetical protein